LLRHNQQAAHYTFSGGARYLLAIDGPGHCHAMRTSFQSVLNAADVLNVEERTRDLSSFFFF